MELELGLSVKDLTNRRGIPQALDHFSNLRGEHKVLPHVREIQDVLHIALCLGRKTKEE